MMMIRRLTDSGRTKFREWLGHRADGDQPSQSLLDGIDDTELAFDITVDPDKKFSSRYEFGKYMVDVLEPHDGKVMLQQRNDGVWDWLTVLYFKQFGAKVSKHWHYTVTRRGHSGSLAYRHLARTAFEMYWRHGPDSIVMLHVDMATWGDLSEQFTSRQNVAYHRGYVRAANALYISDGKLRRGAAARVRPLAKRKPGETIGRGAAARLALAVRRLCRTYDTHDLDTHEMLSLLPREFKSFIAKASAKVPQEFPAI